METAFAALIAQKIAYYVKDHWEKSARPLPLSSLGIQLSKDNLSTKALFPQGGFFPFVKTIAADYGIDFVQDTDRHERIFLFPAGAVNNKEELLQPPIEVRRPSYPASVWNAFIDKIDQGHRRYIPLPPGESYIDLPQNAPSPKAVAEVGEEFLNVSGRFIAPEEVHGRIAHWMSSTNLSASDLSLTEPKKSEAIHGNLLASFLNQLSDDQRKSLNLRADIVLHFLR